MKFSEKHQLTDLHKMMWCAYLGEGYRNPGENKYAKVF